MKRDFYVYVFYRDSRMVDPFYVGKGRGHRVIGHEFKSSLSKRTPKTCAIKKLLRTLGFVPKAIVADGLSESEAFEIERILIKTWGRIDLGTGILTNTTDGGDGVAGLIHSPAHRAKNSAALRGRVFTAEHRAKIGAAHKGRTLSDDRRAALSAIRTGTTRSIEARISTSNSLRGRPKTDAHKLKLQEAARRAWAKRKARAAERVTIVQ